MPLLIVAILTCVTYVIKVYSDWWLGQLKTMTGYSETDKLLIYGGLILAFGCAFGMAQLCHIWTSSRISSYIVDQACTSLAYCKLSWFQDQKIIKVASRINKVVTSFDLGSRKVLRIKFNLAKHCQEYHSLAGNTRSGGV